MKYHKAELKRIISNIKSGQIPIGPGRTDLGPLPATRRSAPKLVESVLYQAGLDESKVGRLASERQRALRSAFDKQRAANAKMARSGNAAFRSAMASRAAAFNLLRVPFIPAIVSLNQPFLIWQLPHPQLNLFIDSHIEPLNSSVKVLVDTDRESNATRFVFFFIWSNDTDSFAVVNINSSLIVAGACSVQAKSGIFSGDVARLNIDASLSIIRWSGWGSDPVTGQSNDQTPHPDFQPTHRQNIAALRAEGGHIFQDGDFKSKSFAFDQFAVSHRLLVVPNRASVLFQVALEFFYDFDGGNDIQDKIFADFAEGANAVFCPSLELEILTPLSGLQAVQAQNSGLFPG